MRMSNSPANGILEIEIRSSFGSTNRNKKITQQHAIDA